MTTSHKYNSFEITLKQAAKRANVSVATIHNWIKAGYLKQSKKGIVPLDSFDALINTIIGTGKLSSRANKQFKDSHNHEEITERIQSLIQNLNFEKIGSKYEDGLSNSYRNKEGIYYTPVWVVKDMLNKHEIKPEHTFLDPCCGSGNFIIEAIKAGISPENVYGFDIDENAVLITKERIRKEFGFDSQNIKVGNFLEIAPTLKKEKQQFDFILTNPPWGKKIKKEEKEKYAKLFDCGNSLDTTSLFMGASFTILRNNGILGFLVQEAFFNITSFEDIRNKILNREILQMTDYGKAFKGLLTKAQSIIIRNKPAKNNIKIECKYNSSTFFRSLNSFQNNPKSIFNFWANESDSQVINRLYDINHIILLGKSKWAMGIVTGNNKKFCSTESLDNYIPIYKGSDITKSGLKEPTTYILNNFSLFQQVAPLENYRAKEKLIYKFISSNLCFFYDDKQRFILNSANLLIPFDIIEITAQQLVKLLNSEIINWLFKNLFSTHKVLRSDLELLPIHIDYFKNNTTFTEESYLDYLQIFKDKNGDFKVVNSKR